MKNEEKYLEIINRVLSHTDIKPIDSICILDKPEKANSEITSVQIGIQLPNHSFGSILFLGHPHHNSKAIAMLILDEHDELIPDYKYSFEDSDFEELFKYLVFRYKFEKKI